MLGWLYSDAAYQVLDAARFDRDLSVPRSILAGLAGRLVRGLSPKKRGALGRDAPVTGVTHVTVMTCVTLLKRMRLGHRRRAA